MLSKISLFYNHSEMVVFWTYIHSPPQIHMYGTVYINDWHLGIAHKHRRAFVAKIALLFIPSRSGEEAVFQAFNLLSLSGKIMSLRPRSYSKTMKNLGMGPESTTQACLCSLCCSHSKRELKWSLNLELFQTLKWYADLSGLLDTPASYHPLFFMIIPPPTLISLTSRQFL